MSKKGGDGPKETEEEKALAEIGLERWEDYQRDFVPVENKAISQVLQEINDPSMEGEGLANISSQMAFTPVEEQVAQGMIGRGAGPGSGAFESGLMGVGLDRVASSSQGQAGAFGLQRRLNVNNLQNLVAIGQGQASGALSGMQDVADAASKQAIFDARASAAARAALGNVIGTGAGLAYGIHSSGQNTPAYVRDSAASGYVPTGREIPAPVLGGTPYDSDLYGAPGRG